MFAIGLEVTANHSAADLTAGRGFSPLDEVADQNGNVYKFVLASGTVAQYDVVAISTAGVAQALTKALADAGAFIGVAQAALSSGEYGYACVQGLTTMQVLSTCSAGIALYTTGTAGKLDDTTTSQTKIAGVQLVANATTSGAYAAILTARPFAAL